MNLTDKYATALRVIALAKEALESMEELVSDRNPKLDTDVSTFDVINTEISAALSAIAAFENEVTG